MRPFLSLSLSSRSPFLLLVDRPTYGSLVPLRSSYHCVGCRFRGNQIEFFDRAGEEERRKIRERSGHAEARERVRHPGRKKGREGGVPMLFLKNRRHPRASSFYSLSLHVFKFVEVRLGQLLPQILAIALPPPYLSPFPHRALLPRVSSRWWRRLPVVDAFFG